MTVTVYALLVVALLTLAGLALVLNLPAAHRDSWLPASPVVGAALLVCLGAFAILVAPLERAAWGIAALLGVGVVVGIVRSRRAPVPGRAWRGLGVGGVVATGVLLVATLPGVVAGAGARLILPSDNNDGFYFVSTAKWFVRHTVWERPLVLEDYASGVVSVGYGPASETWGLSLRIGQDLVQGVLAVVTGIPETSLFGAAIAAWAAIAAVGAIALARRIGVGERLPAATGLLVGLSAVVVTQVHAQNAASLLGIAVGFVAVSAALGIVSPTGRPDASAVIVGAVALAALAGSYPEGLLVIGPVIVGAALWRRRVLAGLLAGVLVLGVSLLASPVSWVRAVSGVIGIASLSSQRASGSTPVEILTGLGGPLARLLEIPQLASVRPAVGVALVLLALVVGALIGAAFRVPALRGLAAGCCVALVATVALGVASSPYSFHRAVDVVSPFVVAVAALSACHLPRAVPRVLRLGAGVVGVGFLAVNLAIDGAVAAQPWSSRIVTEDFDEVAGFVTAADPTGGAEVAVATAGMFEQLWLSEALSDMPSTWLSARGDLGYRGSDVAVTEQSDARPDRWIVVGPGALVDADARALVAEFGRFRIYDSARGTVAVALPGPVPGRWSLDGTEARCGASVRVRTYPESAGTTLELRAMDADAGTLAAQVPGASRDGDLVSIQLVGDGDVATTDADCSFRLAALRIGPAS